MSRQTWICQLHVLQVLDTAHAEERSTASSLADTGGSVGGLLALGGYRDSMEGRLSVPVKLSFSRGGPFLASLLGWQLTFVLHSALTAQPQDSLSGLSQVSQGSLWSAFQLFLYCEKLSFKRDRQVLSCESIYFWFN